MQVSLKNCCVQASFSGSRTQPRVVPRAAAPEAEQAPAKKLGPLQRGGTLQGDQALGKDAAPATKQSVTATAGVYFQIVDGKFRDDRWINGRWDLSQFAGKDGETDWDKVIDAEMGRRKVLEESPIPCTNEDPVLFDTAEIPWWAWVRRFHLPEAEKLNGRAAMMGYVLAIFVDKLSGAGLVDQQNSFLGMLALHLTVFAILLVRNVADLDKYKNLFDEATFYDKQWNATWEGVTRPSERK